jgi:hypothetical protein
MVQPLEQDLSVKYPVSYRAGVFLSFHIFLTAALLR